MKEHLKEIFDYQDMVNSLVRRDLRGKYKGSVDVYQSTVPDDRVYGGIFRDYTQ